jgi:hypothetical protein
MKIYMNKHMAKSQAKTSFKVTQTNAAAQLESPISVLPKNAKLCFRLIKTTPVGHDESWQPVYESLCWTKI